MTIRTPSWLQAGSFPAENDRLLLKSLLGGSANQAPANGVVGGADLAITASPTPDMHVHAAAGAAFIIGSETTTQGVYGFLADAAVDIGPLAASDATNDRISLIVAQVLDAAYSGASNVGQIVEVAGVPASSPVAPAVPKNSIVLAQVRVAKLATTITSGAITDFRVFLNAEPYGATVYRSAAWTTGTAMGTLGLDTVLYDPSGMWDNVNKQFVIPATAPGRYLVSGAATYTQTAASQWAWLQAIQNGSARLVAPPVAAGAATNPSGAVLSGVINCAGGDTIALQSRFSTAGLTGNTGPSGLYFQVERLSRPY